MDYSGRSLKAQMKQAGRLKARFALIVGDNELENNEAVLRNMTNQEQTTFPLQDDFAQECEHLADLLINN